MVLHVMLAAVTERATSDRAMQTLNTADRIEHLSGYQARDFEVVDYRMYELQGTKLWFRGPPPDQLASNAYFSCIGAAQTFGCFCEAPYPDLLAKKLGMPVLSLGYGGAGPEFFLRQEALLCHLNRSRFVILQIMSARSQSNSYYNCGGLEYVTLNATGEKTGAASAFNRLLQGPAPGFGGRVGRKLSNLAARPRTRSLVAEIRAAWTDSMQQLLDRIEVPVVLFWFSRRAADYQEDYRNSARLFGEFPHLVTSNMIAGLKGGTHRYVESISSRGSPQPLISRFTGQPVTVETARDRPDLARNPWKENSYYPSPEMHEDGAAALFNACLPLAEAG